MCEASTAPRATTSSARFSRHLARPLSRLPQTYVENIFFAKPGDYRKADIRIFEGGFSASFVELPVLRAAPARER